MQVIVARTAGFCKGVRKALEVTLEAIQKRKDGESICTYGPLIHNKQVLAMLEEKGIREENHIENCANKHVVIRAHGIPPQERQELHRLGATLLNATCTRVARVHGVIKRHARRGYHTVITGDADHAEVIGLMGYTDGRGVVISKPEQVEALPADWDKVLLVAQTTQNEEIFNEIQDRFLKRYPNGIVKNTICGSTHERQAEVRELCSQVDAMVIVGGLHSGNTVRLAEIARESGVPTFHIETEAELDRQEMAHYSRVGVSAGASTPNWIIRDVVRFLESIQPQDFDFKHKIKTILNLLVYGNFFVALGAALLPSIAHSLTGLSGSLAESSGMAACYAFAIHSLNIYLDRNAIQLNDPGRAAFYHRWRYAFTSLSIAAAMVSLWLALNIGILTFLAMTVFVLLGVLYAVPLILPARWQNLSVLKIKDIPTSKTFSVPIAWACVTVLLPHLPDLFRSFSVLIYAFWVVFLLVLARTALLDLLAVQGDRLVGKETLVVLVGEEKTKRFIMAVLGLLCLSLLVGSATGVAHSFALLMVFLVGVYVWYLGASYRNPLKEDPTHEALIESGVMGIGMLSLLWNAVVGI